MQRVVPEESNPTHFPLLFRVMQRTMATAGKETNDARCVLRPAGINPFAFLLATDDTAGEDARFKRALFCELPC